MPTRKSSKTICSAVLVFFVCASFLFAGGATEDSKGTSSQALKRGGHAIVMQEVTFTTMDPHLKPGDFYPRDVFNNLVTYRADDKGNYGIVADLAESWDIKNDGIVFNIRKGVKFHDGSLLNADVVAWNLKRIMTDPNSAQAYQFKPYVDLKNPATVLSEYSVKLNLTTSSAVVLMFLGGNGVSIASKAAFEKNGADWMRKHAVGTGPFKFIEWVPDSHVAMERNPDYWEMGIDGKPKPYIDKLTVRIVLEIATQINEMLAGTADFMQYIPGRSIEQIKKSSFLTYKENVLSGWRRQAGFNAKSGIFAQAKEPQSLYLRRAVQHALNTEALAKALGGPIGQPYPFVLYPGHPAHDPKAPHYEYDPAKAKEYIAKTGLKLPIPITLTSHARDVDIQQAEMMQAMLKEVGFDVKIELLERTAWVQAVREDGKFELATRRGGSSIAPIAAAIQDYSEEQGSISKAKLPEVVALLNEAAREFDVKRQREIFAKAWEKMNDSAWLVYMWLEMGNYAYNNRLKGVSDYIWSERTHDAQDWWISK
jgi:ABC-type transport system substrate-binding protein